MYIKLSISYIISFLLLTIVMLEFYETVHILVGRLRELIEYYNNAP